jgi:hypothetical protein
MFNVAEDEKDGRFTLCRSNYVNRKLPYTHKRKSIMKGVMAYPYWDYDPVYFHFYTKEINFRRLILASFFSLFTRSAHSCEGAYIRGQLKVYHSE